MRMTVTIPWRQAIHELQNSVIVWITTVTEWSMNDVAATIKKLLHESVHDQVEMRELDFVVNQVNMNQMKVVVIV